MLSSLTKITSRSKKRVGRGIGSGKGGHTAGRGTKGHKARQGGNIPLWFEGGQLPLIKRLPYQRGKFRFKSLNAQPIIVSLEKLSLVEGGVVTKETLVACGILRHVSERVKIVSGKNVPAVREVRGIALSASAKTALEKTGCAIY